MTPRIIAAIRHLMIWTTIAMGLFLLNAWLNHSSAYWFLTYNLLLAWIPLGLAVLAARMTGRWLRRFTLVWWLLFLPNAFYIITDYVHLFRYASRVSYVFDALMIGGFAVLGFILGLISLEIVMKIPAVRRFGHHKILLTTVAILCGGAIYVGRVLRWNSWDVAISPLGIWKDIVHIVTLPYELALAISTTSLFAAMILSSYSLLRRISSRYRPSSRS